ncbi:hypothetical protein RvY_18628 [Ramazzottius varieornatus]|uniref:Uncharacterized protein n=1 Tax=Ramazzottius varieornatus TaxID=947166 RepID=A0A1D1W6H1_RAMVA|nr:hypothetical protein RvY_18628 [Ramazzottius varieornatus]
MPKRDALLSITKNHPTIFEFHEFVTITSWIMQLLLNAVLLFKMYKRLTLHGRVMDLVVSKFTGRGSFIALRRRSSWLGV